jgi:putative ABC transport system substrate-binding protein
VKRREFITYVGGAAAWPMVARAQQPERMRRVGTLTASAVDDPDAQARQAAFLQGLTQLGWREGRNLRIDARFAAGNADNTRKYAAELVALAPDVIVAGGSAPVEPRNRSCRRPAPYQSCSLSCPTQSALATSEASLDRVVTPLVS